MITIYSPCISMRPNGNCRLSADVDFGAKTSEMWLEVPAEYSSWLCEDRCDAFLVAIVYYALLNGEDITCQAPVSEPLLYKLREYLVDGLCKADSTLKHIAIHASAIPCLPAKAEGAVITGMSCGIDSLHALAHLSEENGYSGMRLTHLLFNKVGAQGTDEFGEMQHQFRIANSIDIAKEMGLPLVQVESNVQLLLPLKHVAHGGYRNAFVILVLQKGIRVFFQASEKTFAQLDLSEHKESFTSYDLLLMDVFSLPSLQFYNEGANLTRFEKTRQVAAFPPSYKHLNVCFWKNGTGRNCTVHCEKCQRTILDLETIGALEKYRAVFDLDAYYKEKLRIFRQAVKMYARGHQKYRDSFAWMLQQQPILVRLWYLWYRFLNFFRRKGHR